MTEITREEAEAALKAWYQELNLSDEQKQQVQTAFDQAKAKLSDMAAKGETIDGPAARSNLRAAVEKWLSPEQLEVWDRGFDKVRAALGL